MLTEDALDDVAFEDPEPATTVIAAPIPAEDMAAALPPAFAEAVDPLPPPTTTVTAAKEDPVFDEVPEDAFVDVAFPPDPASTVTAAKEDPALEAVLVVAFADVTLILDPASTVTAAKDDPALEAALVEVLFPPEPASTVMAARVDPAFETVVDDAFDKVEFPSADLPASITIALPTAVVVVAAASPAGVSVDELIKEAFEEDNFVPAIAPCVELSLADTMTLAALVLLAATEVVARANDGTAVSNSKEGIEVVSD